MTNYQKSQLSDHFHKWNVAYSMAAFLIVALALIAWEAKQEQRLDELEQYYEHVEKYKDIA